MAAVSQPKITRLPPGPIRPELTYAGNATPVYPVSAKFNGDDWESPGLAFEDYSRMSTQQRKQSGARRLPTPAWSLNNDLLRNVLVRYAEVRAGFKRPQPGTDKERLARAQARLDELRPARIATLDSLCRRFVALKQQPDVAPARLRTLAQHIEALDTVIRFDSNIATTVTGVVYGYYRRALDSVGVGNELGMKPPHVRQMLWRLWRESERLNAWRGPRMCINVLGDYAPKPAKVVRQVVCRPKFNLELAAQMRAAGKTYKEIAAALGVYTATISTHLKRAGLDKKPQLQKPLRPVRLLDIAHATVLMADPTKSFLQISVEMGVPRNTLVRQLRKFGLYDEKRPCAKQYKKFDEELAARLFYEGKTIRKIGPMVGVSHMTLSNHFKRNGFKRARAYPNKCKAVDVELAIRMMAENKSWPEIRKAVGATRETIKAAVVRSGREWVPRKVGMKKARNTRGS